MHGFYARTGPGCREFARDFDGIVKPRQVKGGQACALPTLLLTRP
jgi:hypothetical protein